jgi:hypothetical protein
MDETLTLVRGDPRTQRIAIDPDQAVTRFAPPTEDLVELSARADLDSPESLAMSSGKAPQPRVPLAADAPEWMRAARVLAESLESMIARGTIGDMEHAAILRSYDAWTMNGARQAAVLKVARLVRRAHEVLRQSPVPSEQTIQGCAEIIYNNLPQRQRTNLPFERALWVVRSIAQVPDPWVAIVHGTVELLGWADGARAHAAYVIRSAIHRG